MENKLIRGVIYKYTSPSGKCYIGQTINEKRRRNDFLNEKDKSYAGPKINNARKKYGPKNFEYEILFAVESYVKEEVRDLLNQKEIQYIEMFDSFYNGYNSDRGGNTCSHVITEETKQKLSESITKFYETHESELAKPILQYSLDGKFIREWPSIHKAAVYYKVKDSTIGEVCRGYRNYCGDYTWRYKEDFDDIPDTINIKNKHARAKVKQYSLNGEFIREWDNMSQAAMELGYSLGNFSTYCNGRNNHEYKGFLYYRGSETPNLINI